MSVRDDQPRKRFRYLHPALTLPSPAGRGGIVSSQRISQPITADMIDFGRDKESARRGLHHHRFVRPIVAALPVVHSGRAVFVAPPRQLFTHAREIQSWHNPLLLLTVEVDSAIGSGEIDITAAAGGVRPETFGRFYIRKGRASAGPHQETRLRLQTPGQSIRRPSEAYVKF
jgi:hypothetical protein